MAGEVIRWEWEGARPDTEEMMRALESLAPVWGIETKGYAVHVLPMHQAVTAYYDENDQRVPSKEMAKSSRKVMVWKLYMQVAGRLAMLNAAAEQRGWRVNFVPADTSSTQYGRAEGETFVTKTPAFSGSAVVYREFCEIWAPIEEGEILQQLDGAGKVVDEKEVSRHLTGEFYLLGSRPGMAALKSGGFVPPWEKMETAARGRAIGAWGFGVLPGSGIATSDEMELVTELGDYAATADDVERVADMDREGIEDALRSDIEKLRTVRDRPQDEMAKVVQALIYEVANKKAEIIDGVVQFDGIRTQHLELVRRRLTATLREVRSTTE